MAQQGKEASVWLKQKVLLLPSSLRYPSCLMEQDPISNHVDPPLGPLHDTAQPTRSNTHNVSQAIEVITAFWKRIWDRNTIPDELHRLRANDLTKPRGQPMSDDWRLTVEEVQKIAAKNHGATGPDGWSSEEIHCWPETAWRLLLDLWEHWTTTNSYPEVWRHCRQVMIPKDDPGGDTSGAQSNKQVEHMRPICIFPIVCRIFS